MTDWRGAPELVPHCVSIASLGPHARNARKHNAKNLEAIKASFQRFGQQRAVLVHTFAGETVPQVISGNGGLRAAVDLGWKDIAVTRFSGDDAEAEAYAIADNRTAELSEWDRAVLHLQAAAMKTSETLAGLYQSLDLESLFPAGQSVAEDGPVPAPPAKPRTKPGTLYELGEHRLVCGDAFAEKDLVRLLVGGADMVFTDPPYNVDYGSSKNPKHKIRKIAGDARGREDWTAFNTTLARILKTQCRGDVYLWGASGPEGMRQRLTLVDAGAHWSATIIWKKQQLVLSPAKYQRIYEPCFYGWFGKSSYRGDRTQVEVWEIDRPHDSPLHPTMKPVALCGRGIANSSREGATVLDLFGGSGSTMIACEELGRRCRMMEIEPGYCDVIVDRWERFTGRKAKAILPGRGK